jgi:TRAP-type C4-dicarboxylate transport system permease small subunit
MIRLVDQVLTVVAAIIVAATAVITCIAVFCRSVLHSSLPWPEEVTGYLLVWTSFIGAYLAVRDDSHIGFDLLVEKLGLRSQKVLRTITDTILIVFFVVLVRQSWRMLTVVGNTPLQTLEAIPVGLFIAALPLCGVGIIVALCLRIVDRWRVAA